jgi:hypothetical protein
MEGVYITAKTTSICGTCSRHCRQPFVWCTGSFGSASDGSFFFSRAIGRRMNRERRRLAAARSGHLSERILGRSDVESLTRRHGRRLRRNCGQMNSRAARSCVAPHQPPPIHWGSNVRTRFCFCDRYSRSWSNTRAMDAIFTIFVARNFKTTRKKKHNLSYR